MWLGETPFVQVSTTWALTCLETVHQRPCMMREIETQLSDNRVIRHRCFLFLFPAFWLFPTGRTAAGPTARLCLGRRSALTARLELWNHFTQILEQRLPCDQHTIYNYTHPVTFGIISHRYSSNNCPATNTDTHTHTHTFYGPFSRTTRVSTSASCSGHITTPAPHHSVFYRPDALPAAQPTASKHWRQTTNTKYKIIHIPYLLYLPWLWGHSLPLPFRPLPPSRRPVTFRSRSPHCG